MARKMECPRWSQACEKDEVLKNGIELGKSLTGETVYVGRCFDTNAGEAIPGKVVPSLGACYYGYLGEEHKSDNYEVLTASKRCQLQWVAASGGAIPVGAVEAGFNMKAAEPTFIARATINSDNSNKYSGRVTPSHGCAFVTYNGHETAAKSYEVLCTKYKYS